MATAYIGLGSNLGDRAANLRAGLDHLRRDGVRVADVSPIYETEPVGHTPEPVPGYLNCVARIETELAPLALLDRMQAAERAAGSAPTFRWGPRTLDLDLLLYDDLAMESERLTVPHPRMRERRFVLAPLAEMAPGLVLPGGESVAERLADPAVRSQVVRVWCP